MVPQFPLVVVTFLALSSSSLWTSSKADEEVETSFSVGGSVTLTCPRKNAGNSDILMKWSIASRTIFEDESLAAGVEKSERYR